MAQTRSATKASENNTHRRQAVHPLTEEAETASDVVEYLKEYAREKPEVAALWCLGIGFILGWKLKPW
ncbi:MAG TPA: hypothetical protein VGM76_02550 [Lacipirellulaceae bacterium]|jgi:hypothetical protein